MRTCRQTAALLVAAAVLATPFAGRADSSDTFGPSQGLQIQPEIDVVKHAGEAFRVILKFEPTSIPSSSYGEMGSSLYLDWLVAPLTHTLLSPDLAKRRRLDVRVGISWYPTVWPGTSGWSNVVQAEAEATMRTNLPGGVLATLRNRAEARWQLDEPRSFQWRFRTRPQLEREFVLSRQAGTSLTPFVNAEFFWTTAEHMWAQYRMQVGVQLGVDWFGKGQVLELNGSIFTYLEPTRSHAPVVGMVWYQYF